MSSSFVLARRLFARTSLFVAALLLPLFTGEAQTLSMSQIDQAVWANLYGVTPAQYNSSTWLAQDTDGDGITNSAEMAAGTDPFSAGSTIQISSMSATGGNLTVTFPTLAGKQYVFQSNTSLSNSSGWTQVAGTAPVSGTNGSASITAAYAANTFYRVLVQDVDTNGDGLSDWAALKLGLDPANATAQSNGTTNAYGQYLTDSVYVANQISAQNQITITASDAYATEPAVGSAATDSAQLTLSRGGMAAMLGALTVSVTIGGNAVSGTDFVPLSTSVTFAAGVRAVNVPVTPLANAALKSPVTVTMTVAPGTGYTVGAANVAGVLIYPQGLVNGTGLTGNYYNYSSSTYNAPQNFFGTPVVANELDAGINFLWNTRNANSIYAPLGGGSVSTCISQTNYSIKWTGQVQPQYTETYTFEVDARDGVLLRVGGQTIINSWSDPGGVNTASGTSNGILAGTGVRTGKFAAQAGVRYDIELDYYTLNGNLSSLNTNTAPQVALSWYSYDQPRQLIPSNRLYPTTADANAAPPSITSSLSAVGYLNQPFTYNVATGSNSSSTVVGIQSGSLPPGLTFSQQTLSSGVAGLSGVVVGQISGTPTVAGTYQLTVQASNAAGTAASVLTVQIIDTGSGITKEVWTGLAATSANVLNIPTATTPNITGTLSSLEDNTTTYGTSFGERLQGFITVNQTANYYFWLAANDSAELYISDSAEVGAKVRRAWVTPGGTSSRQWSVQASQQSGWILLQAGQKYYVEVLHQTLNGSASNLAVGFNQDPTGYSAPIANGSGVVPGYMLWQYYAPPVSFASQAASVGTLYYTQMGPEDGAITNGSGLATLALNGAGTQATLSYSYDGLTTPLTQHHLHNDDYVDANGIDHPSSIIFDLDTAPPTGTNQYTWNIAPVGTFTNVSDLLNVIRQGKCYLNLHTVNYPNGEIRGNFTLANGAQTFVPPAPQTYSAPANPTAAQASRFLNQASFGPSSVDLAAVESSGFRPWIENQLTLPSSHISDFVQKQPQYTPDAWAPNMAFNAWWRRSVTAPDQLRQRMAFALSEFMVVSNNGGPLGSDATLVSNYYDLLLDNAFDGADTGTSFRDLMKAVTLSPAMGMFLNMQGNAAGSLITGVHANENFAREVHQLFSINLYRLWPDGSLVLDSNFNLIPTYDQSFIQNVTPIFTGWNYHASNQANGRLPTGFGGTYDPYNPMTLFPQYHDLGQKEVLDNVWVPAPAVTNYNTTLTETNTSSPYYGMNVFDEIGLKDLDAALNSIFYHPNLGPYFCRQMIQRLVTSNPSPAYVYRVVRAFNGEMNVDGVTTGYRGDLKDTLRAILMDFEARDDSMLNSTTFGKQREPLLRVAAPSRYFAPSVSAVTGTFSQSSSGAHPGRITVNLSSPISNLQVNDNISLYFGQQGIFAQNNGSGSAGTVMTITSANHGLAVGNAVFLRFALTIGIDSSGSIPPDGLYTVQTVPNSSVFTVAPAITSGAGAITISPALISGTTKVMFGLMTSGTQLPANEIYTGNDPNYTALSVTPTSGASVTSCAVNAYGQYTGSYNQSGTVITVTASGHSLNPSGSVYLKFAPGTGGQPADGVYQVLASNFTVSSFQVTAAVSATITGSADCILNRIPIAGFYVSGTTTNVVTFIPHGLQAGNSICAFISTQSGVTASQTYPVLTAPTPTTFTIATPVAGLQTQTGVLFPLVAPEMNRSGNLAVFTSNWQIDQSDGDSTTASIGQTPFRSPTVFNFFYPTYTYPGSLAYNGVTVPEFQLSSDASTMALTNFLEQAFYSGNTDGSGAPYANLGISSFRGGSENIIMDYSRFMTTAYTTDAGIPTLVAQLNNEMMGGTMSSAMSNALIAYVANQTNFPYTGTPTASQMKTRLQAVIHVILVSPEYAIQR